MKNDNCRTFKQNQIFFCIHSSIVKDWRPVVFGEDRLWEGGSLPATFYVLTLSLIHICCRITTLSAVIVYNIKQNKKKSNAVQLLNIETQLSRKQDANVCWYVTCMSCLLLDVYKRQTLWDTLYKKSSDGRRPSLQ